MNKEKKQIKPMICPVCGKFYFSELTDDEIESGESPNSVQCSICGWYYDLEQLENPDLVAQSNELSLNQFIKKYKETIKINPKFVFSEAKHPEAKPHKCPVCGEYSFADKDTYDICPICGWEDDGYFASGGANDLSLEEAIKEFKAKRIENPKYKWKDIK